MHTYGNDLKKKDFFLVFCITIFPEKAQNKNKVGIKATF
jgi:hypothetical protein